MLRNVWGRWARTGLPSKKDLKDNFYLNGAWAPSSLVVNCYSGVTACEESPINQVEVGLGIIAGVQSRVVPINYGYPKLTGIVSSYTGIGWKYPVSKSFLPRLS